jgi:hypothetical protein
MARDADTTAPQNAPAEQRAAREQRMTADEREPRPSLKAPRRRSGGEVAGIGSGRLPGRIKNRLTGDGGRVAALVCGDRGRVHGVDEEQRCRQHSHGGAQQEDAASHSEVRVREPANLEGHQFGETEAAREELLHIRGLEEEFGPFRPHEASCEAPGEPVPQGGEHEGSPGVRGGVCCRAQHQVDLATGCLTNAVGFHLVPMYQVICRSRWPC